jgi:hypothetical protein
MSSYAVVHTPTMIVNGQSVSTTFQQWANIVLTGSDLTTFINVQTEHKNFVNELIANGALIFDTVYHYRDTGNVVTGNVIKQHRWGVSGNIITGSVTITSTLNSDGSEQHDFFVDGELMSSVNSADTNRTGDFIFTEFLVDGVRSNIKSISTNIINPQNIDLTTPEWLVYWDRYISDANVTFPSGFGTVTNT